jgi:hypothetical protein
LDVFEVESAGSDEFAQSTGCSSSKVGFGWASGVVGFGGIEADQANAGLAVMNADSVAIYNLDIGGADRLSKAWRCQEQRSASGYEEAGHRGISSLVNFSAYFAANRYFTALVARECLNGPFLASFVVVNRNSFRHKDPRDNRFGGIAKVIASIGSVFWFNDYGVIVTAHIIDASRVCCPCCQQQRSDTG